MLDFHDARQWLIKTYGFSESIGFDVELNKHWAFYMRYQSYMIYVKDDEELNWFKLKHGQEVE